MRDVVVAWLLGRFRALEWSANAGATAVSGVDQLVHLSLAQQGSFPLEIVLAVVCLSVKFWQADDLDSTSISSAMLQGQCYCDAAFGQPLATDTLHRKVAEWEVRLAPNLRLGILTASDFANAWVAQACHRSCQDGDQNSWPGRSCFGSLTRMLLEVAYVHAPEIIVPHESQPAALGLAAAWLAAHAHTPVPSSVREVLLGECLREQGSEVFAAACCTAVYLQRAWRQLPDSAFPTAAISAGLKSMLLGSAGDASAHFELQLRIKVLTLHGVWAHAIVQGKKTIENRRRALKQGWYLVRSGQTLIKADQLAWAKRCFGGSLPTDVPAGAILGMVLVGETHRKCSCEACSSEWRSQNAADAQIQIRAAMTLAKTIPCPEGNVVPVLLPKARWAAVAEAMFQQEAEICGPKAKKRTRKRPAAETDTKQQPLRKKPATPETTQRAALAKQKAAGGVQSKLARRGPKQPPRQKVASGVQSKVAQAACKTDRSSTSQAGEAKIICSVADCGRDYTTKKSKSGGPQWSRTSKPGKFMCWRCYQQKWATRFVAVA